MLFNNYSTFSSPSSSKANLLCPDDFRLSRKSDLSFLAILFNLKDKRINTHYLSTDPLEKVRKFTGKIKVLTNTKKSFLVLFNKIVISDLIVICDKIS